MLERMLNQCPSTANTDTLEEAHQADRAKEAAMTAAEDSLCSYSSWCPWLHMVTVDHDLLQCSYIQRLLIKNNNQSWSLESSLRNTVAYFARSRPMEL